MNNHANQPDSHETDPFEGKTHAADRLREAMGGQGKVGLDPALRQRLMQAATPAMEANRSGAGSLRASKPFVRRVAPWAAAAALLLTVSVVVLTQRPATTTSDQIVASIDPADPMDINVDGVVDILDALATARGEKYLYEQAADSDSEPRFASADRIAARVVRLDSGGGAG